MSTLVERLRAGCTDWDGSQMADETPPMDCLTVGDARQAADEIERLTAQAEANAADAARLREQWEKPLLVLWPLICRLTQDLVFTADRAGEVRAAIQSLRSLLRSGAAMAAQPAQEPKR